MNWSSIHVYWYVLPLILAISLVYAASRNEDWPKIWRHAAKLSTGIVVAMLIATVVLYLINTQVDGA